MMMMRLSLQPQHDLRGLDGKDMYNIEWKEKKICLMLKEEIRDCEHSVFHHGLELGAYREPCYIDTHIT